MRFRSHPVLPQLSLGYPSLKGRLLTCYSPVRRFLTPRGVFSLDLHVLATPPAFTLSQNQTLRTKFSSNTEPSSLSYFRSSLSSYSYLPYTTTLPFSFYFGFPEHLHKVYFKDPFLSLYPILLPPSCQYFSEFYFHFFKQTLKSLYLSAISPSKIFSTTSSKTSSDG